MLVSFIPEVPDVPIKRTFARAILLGVLFLSECWSIGGTEQYLWRLGGSWSCTNLVEYTVTNTTPECRTELGFTEIGPIP